METQVITPQPGQSVIVTGDDDHHGRHRGEHGIDWKILTEQAAGFREAAANFTTTVRDIKDARFDLSGQLASGFSGTSEKLCDVKGTISHLGERVSDGFGSASTQAEKIGAALGVAIERNTAALGVQSDKNAAALGLQATTFAGQASVAAQNFFNLSNVQVERVRAELTGQADRNTFELRLQAERNASAAALAAEKCCCELKQIAFENASKAELTARSLAADAAKQLAECCCELKEKMSTIESDRLREELNQLKIESAVAKACSGKSNGGGHGNG